MVGETEVGVPHLDRYIEQKAASILVRLGALKRDLEKSKDSEQFISELAAIEAEINALKAKSKGDLGKLTKIMEGMSAEYDKLLAVCNDLRIQIFRLESPPHAFVTFVRYIRMERLDPEMEETEAPLIEVKSAGGRLVWVYYLDKKVKVEDLKYGQILKFAAKDGREVGHALEALDQFKTEGVVGTVQEVLEADHLGTRYLISTSETGSTPVVVHVLAAVPHGAVEKGSRILVDFATHLIIEVLTKHKETSEEYIPRQVPDVTFDDIGGLVDVKEEVEEYLIEPILYPALYKKQRDTIPAGIAFGGYPGAGKTMLAKAIVNRLHELRVEQLKSAGVEVKSDLKPAFFYIKGSQIITKWLGVPEERLRDIFAMAKRMATPEMPVCLCFDECDALFPVRGSGVSSDAEKYLVPAFNAEVDGLEEGGNVIVVLLSNRMDRVDPAVLRPGRCDHVIYMPRPDEIGAASILEKHFPADWGIINAKYMEDIYYPTDRLGKRRTGADGKEIGMPFRCDPVRVRKYLIDKAIEHMYADRADNGLVTIRYHDGKEQVLRFRHLVSGARLANVVKKAKKFARRRYKKSLAQMKLSAHINEYATTLSPEEFLERGIEHFGITRHDLHMAIEQEFESIKVPESPQDFLRWLSIENIGDGKDVAGYDPIKREKVQETD